MQKEYFWIPAFALLALFFAGGVYSQVAQNQAVEDGILQGASFLKSGGHFDSELLIVYLVNEKRSDLGLMDSVQANISKIDDFHYPLKQFVQGKVISPDAISPATKNSTDYSDFLHYFSCEALSSDWIQSLSSMKDDDSSLGMYKSSHALLLLELIRRDYLGGRCGSFFEFKDSLDSAIALKVQDVKLGLVDKSNFDSWVERVGVLGFVGEPVAQEDVEYILSLQSDNGGWAPMQFEGETLEEERSHTTALAVWALVEASK